MNITPQNITLPLATVVNPQTDALRRENNQREVIAQPAAASQSAGEKGVSSDKDRARTPGQQNEAINFAQLQKQSELENKTISDEQSPHQEEQQNAEQDSDSKSTQASNESGEENSESSEIDKKGLDFAEQQEVTELKRRDLEVRSHEQAHAAAGGATTGAPSYTFEVGPDGKRYAVEGEVSVDLSTVEGNPRATIAKMQKVYSAALAPANPSVQDTRVANQAAQLIAQAQSELLALQLEDPSQARETNNVINNSDVLSSDDEKTTSQKSQDFDAFVNQTLNAQDAIAPSRDLEVDQRAHRIEHFYANINQAYEKPPVSRFELTA
ncbi:putative metalloprotease CJM1_0395 family protein [Thalassotalea profundi]|uniref:Catalase n=1 Tax=Thalassotalea profundi TaxID=2036687 RepID=A0ABQ3IZI6_9GAMM|nr:putative metalloprotease CJM1_0395 family protein [Thalassotalea profundi]GHE96828.1 hypothetical protein GCM10011501_27920 [Thalassotalea profundi]